MPKNVRSEAIKEISREKARMRGDKSETPLFSENSEFSKEATTEETTDPMYKDKTPAWIAWKKKKEGQSEQDKPEKTVSKDDSSIRDIFAKHVVDSDMERLFEISLSKSRDKTEWVQYSPWKKEGQKEKKKEIPLNTATVVAIRKKLIAMEWARARGTKKQDTRLTELEQEAATWKQKREEKKRRKEEIRMRLESHKQVISNAIADFADKLKENKDRSDPKALSGLLEESLENAGEVFDIEWDHSSCLIWIEPWAEKKRRKIYGFDIPVIYRVTIDENLQIVSYEEVDDEEVIEELREELLTKPLKQSLEAVSFDTDNKEQAQQFLEDTLSEIGRLISLVRNESGWLATIEPWEEMRVRNTKRRGRPPVITDEIHIDWKDGKLEFVDTQIDADDQTQMDAESANSAAFADNFEDLAVAEEEEDSPQSTEGKQSTETMDEGLKSRKENENNIEEENVEGNNSSNQNESTE